MRSSEQEMIFRVVFGALICVNFTGNILVCLMVRRFPFMKTPMNYLLVHLAVCDMLVGLFIFPRYVLSGLYDHPDGLTGDLLCKFFTFGNMAWPPSCTSVFTLLVIAWERYNAIMKPLESSRITKRYLKYAIVLCWVLGVSICLPECIVVGYNHRIKSCDFLWKEEWGGEWGGKLDSGLWLFAVGCLPFIVMLILYGRVVHSLWCRHHGNAIAEVSQRSLQLSRKRITKTAVTVTIVLFLCFMPNLIYYFIVNITPPTTSVAESLNNAAPVFYPITHLLLLLNSSVNPFIYALQSTRFRKCMKSLLFGRRREVKSVGERISRRRTFPLRKRSEPQRASAATVEAWNNDNYIE